MVSWSPGNFLSTLGKGTRNGRETPEGNFQPLAILRKTEPARG